MKKGKQNEIKVKTKSRDKERRKKKESVKKICFHSPYKGVHGAEQTCSFSATPSIPLTDAVKHVYTWKSTLTAEQTAERR